jgi:hypothetical protein
MPLWLAITCTALSIPSVAVLTLLAVDYLSPSDTHPDDYQADLSVSRLDRLDGAL